MALISITVPSLGDRAIVSRVLQAPFGSRRAGLSFSDRWRFVFMPAVYFFSLGSLYLRAPKIGRAR